MSLENTLSKSYQQTLKRYPPLPENELNELIRKAHAGDKKAFDKVVQSNLRFVIRVAATFRNAELSFDERVAEGNIGLMRAVEKFDPDRGYKFTTYAVWWIRQAIQKAVWRNRHPFHRPLNQFEDWDRIRQQTDHMAQKTGEMPHISDVAMALEMTPKRFEAALDTQIVPTSLDVSYSDQGGSLSDRLAAETPDPYQQLESQESTTSIHHALATLPPRDAEVLSLTFGLEGETLSFSKVGKRLGISKERVRQLRNRALKTLRKQLHRFGNTDEHDIHNAIELSIHASKEKSVIDRICA